MTLKPLTDFFPHLTPGIPLLASALVPLREQCAVIPGFPTEGAPLASGTSLPYYIGYTPGSIPGFDMHSGVPPLSSGASRFAATPSVRTLNRREELEQREFQELSPVAAKSAMSRGPIERVEGESPDAYRTIFMRDAHRLTHSFALRRLQNVRQVAYAPDQVYRRTRYAHTMEVAQLARAMASALRLNPDLAEAAALAHDVGHAPYGHDGETALAKAMQRYGDTFEHNLQSYRVIRFLERYHPNTPGLNLSLETLYCVLMHRSAYDIPTTAGIDIELPSSPPLEGQLVNVADEIAYIAHDMDDALEAGVLQMSGLLRLELIRELAAQVEQEFGVVTKDVMRAQVKRRLVNTLVEHVVAASQERIASRGVRSLEEVYAEREPLIVFPESIATAKDQVRDHLLQWVYLTGEFKDRAQEAREIVDTVFSRFMDDPLLLPPAVQDRVLWSALPRHRIVCDYVAGLTDTQAQLWYQELTGRSAPKMR